MINIKKFLIILFSLSFIFVASSCGRSSGNNEIEKLQQEIDKLKKSQEEVSEENEKNVDQQTVKVIIEKDYKDSEPEVKAYTNIKHWEAYVGYLSKDNKNLNIHLWFDWEDGGSIAGKYYYDKYKKDLELFGDVYYPLNSTYSESYIIYEYVDGDNTGIFNLGLNDDDTITGTWRPLKSTSPKYNVFLRPVN